MKTDELIEYLRMFPNLTVYVNRSKGDEELDKEDIIEIVNKKDNYLVIG